ncbi:MAG: hypothetical protein AMXMBFR36_29060 [Acidobacteriota bacterium]
MEATRLAELLRALVRHRVEFVLVGGGAAVLAGAAFTTEDLDVVPSFDPENLDRLIGALEELDATYVDPAGRRIAPTRERLESHRLHLLRTRLGRLDVLHRVEPGLDYLQLVERSSWVEVEELRIRTLDLDALIESKEATGRDKDRAHLLILHELRRLRRARDGD